MPTLDWIGKNAVVGHHKKVPYRLIKCDKELSAGAAGEGNLLVEGDNLQALKALLPYYGGKVKCIYIDPPYNTGNEGWIYNDNVNSPEIEKWLGQVVGGEAEDLSRHDKWLCMMYPRLLLMREFLDEDGIILVSIDDSEMAGLRLLLDEIFGKNCFVEQLIITRSENGMGSKEGFASNHEYMLCYKRSISAEQIFCGLTPSTEFLESFNKQDQHGRYKVDGLLRKKGAGARREDSPNCFYPLYFDPKTGQVSLETKSGYKATWPKLPTGADGRWTWSKDFARGKEHRLHGGPKGTIYIKDYFSEKRREKPKSILRSPAYLTDRATNEIRAIFGEKVFTTPKPLRLIADLLDNLTNKNALILDSFAGSATTGHAVLAANAKDGGNRRFILVEMEQKISREITAERLKRAINGYGDTSGLGGGFRYCTLGEPLFDERGQINSSVKFSDLAHHVFFTETGEPMPKRPDKRTPLLGVHNGRAIYLLFNGILGDKQPQSGNVLTNDVLKILPPHAGARVIYGTACRLSANRLKREGLTFRQIPYEIKTN